jgi:hypothetical protein
MRSSDHAPVKVEVIPRVVVVGWSLETGTEWIAGRKRWLCYPQVAHVAPNIRLDQVRSTHGLLC